MKTTLKNRKGQKIVAIVEGQLNKKGLVLIMHGFGGYKEQPQIKTIAKAFLENDYTAVRFDTTNTLGESDGHTKFATPTGYLEDLEDVIEWSRAQSWFKKPFLLVGHSIGSFCISIYAANHLDQVKGIAPLSVTISGKTLKEIFNPEEIKKWKTQGFRQEPSTGKPGQYKTMSWDLLKDFMKYDLLKIADRLTLPVLMAVGENDKGTPYKNQKLFYDKLPGPKELHLIKNAGHTFKTKAPLQELKKIFDQWIKRELS